MPPPAPKSHSPLPPALAQNSMPHPGRQLLRAILDVFIAPVQFAYALLDYITLLGHRRLLLQPEPHGTPPWITTLLRSAPLALAFWIARLICRYCHAPAESSPLPTCAPVSPEKTPSDDYITPANTAPADPPSTQQTTRSTPSPSNDYTPCPDRRALAPLALIGWAGGLFSMLTMTMVPQAPAEHPPEQDTPARLPSPCCKAGALDNIHRTPLARSLMHLPGCWDGDPCYTALVYSPSLPLG